MPNLIKSLRSIFLFFKLWIKLNYTPETSIIKIENYSKKLKLKITNEMIKVHTDG